MKSPHFIVRLTSAPQLKKHILHVAENSSDASLFRVFPNVFTDKNTTQNHHNGTFKTNETINFKLKLLFLP